MSAPKLKLYVDVVSPFGYIAFWVLRVCSFFKSYCSSPVHSPLRCQTQLAGLNCLFGLGNGVKEDVVNYMSSDTETARSRLLKM